MKSRISVNPNIHFGKPCITGTRITVQNILELTREDISFDEIMSDYYPEIEIEDIKACLQYAMKRVLQKYPEGDLHKAFVVIEPGRHRFRKL